MKPKVDIKEITAFVDRLKEERNSVNKKLSFVHEHKFLKEADYLRDRINVINTIIFELEAVLDGNRKGANASFIWQ